MYIPLLTPFAIASRKLVLYLYPRVVKTSVIKPKHAQHDLSIIQFDDINERLFWQERHTESLFTLKIALLLGIAGFLTFIGLDIYYAGLTATEIIGRSQIVLALSILLLHLHRHPHPESQINLVAKLCACLSVADLIGILFVEYNPIIYGQIWIGLFPIYLFSYGQLFMTLADTVVFGLFSMVLMPLTGYLIGVDTITLIPSILILLIANAFGFCTRCQLENHSRNSFHERRKAEIAAEDKTEFLKQLSHNLRQPLQALSCYTSVLETAYQQNTNEQLQPIVGKLGSTVDELNNAFNRILDIVNLESGKQIPLLTAVDVNLLLSNLATQFAPQAHQRGIRLLIKMRSQPPYNIYTDASILTQIISNLIDNAIKYTPNGWIVVAMVKISPTQLKLHVRDTGIGISEPQKDSVFKDFYRGHRRRQDPHVYGLGIGLAYVLKAVELLPRHSLDFYSQPNLGSDFQIRLPIAIEPALGTKLQTLINSDLADSFIFIVDDDQAVLDALAKQLLTQGCLVQKARSKAELEIALIDTLRPPDLLICDFYLTEDETAHDIIATLEADCGPVPTLILSAHAISDADKARWSSNTLLLRKPASAAVLFETIAKALGRC
jgi:signal transduction histidine kinase/CheY-like chemotaxis protein